MSTFQKPKSNFDLEADMAEIADEDSYEFSESQENIYNHTLKTSKKTQVKYKNESDLVPRTVNCQSFNLNQIFYKTR